MQAKDITQIMEVVYKETDMNLENFLMQIQNSDVRRKLLDSIAQLLSSTINFLNSLFRDDLKMTILNTFLVSQGYPAINNRKLVSSGLKLVEKLMATFTR